LHFFPHSLRIPKQKKFFLSHARPPYHFFLKKKSRIHYPAPPIDMIDNVNRENRGNDEKTWMTEVPFERPWKRKIGIKNRGGGGGGGGGGGDEESGNDTAMIAGSSSPQKTHHTKKTKRGSVKDVNDYSRRSYYAPSFANFIRSIEDRRGGTFVDANGLLYMSNPDAYDSDQEILGGEENLLGNDNSHNFIIFKYRLARGYKDSDMPGYADELSLPDVGDKVFLYEYDGNPRRGKPLGNFHIDKIVSLRNANSCRATLCQIING
jgi:hypothetical protein